MYFEYIVHLHVSYDFQTYIVTLLTALIGWSLKCRNRFLSVRRKLNYLYNVWTKLVLELVNPNFKLYCLREQQFLVWESGWIVKIWLVAVIKQSLTSALKKGPL
jgi:hypothetical protein